MHRSPGALATALLFVAASLLVACSDGIDSGVDDDGGLSGSADPTTTADLRASLERLPAASDQVAFLDLVAAREALGLPADAAVEGDEVFDDPDLSHLLLALSAVLPPYGDPREVPLTVALDSGALQQVVSSPLAFGPDVAAALVVTGQPFGEVESALLDEGYERAGDLLVTDELTSAVGYTVVAEGDGAIVLAQSEEVAEEVLAGSSSGSSAVALLDQAGGLDALAAVAVQVADAEPGSCGSGAVATDRFAPRGGTLTVVAGPSADPDQLHVEEGTFPPNALEEVGEVEADGPLLAAEVSLAEDGSSPTGASLLPVLYQAPLADLVTC